MNHAAAFAVTAPPALLFITTRNQEVLVGLAADEHRVDLLSRTQAHRMLAEWTGKENPDRLPPEAAEVARECGYLPLALAMIGAMIRSDPRATAWADALARLKQANLEKIKRTFPGYPYPDLLRAIEVSIDALDAADQERYLDLAVFPEDQPIPEEPLRVLWNLSDVDTRDCMTRLVTRSLATWTTGKTSLILHDLQLDLIYKRREKELPSLHLRLVEAWDALPKLDPYALRWVTYHLVQADRKDDLRRLLLEFNYLQAKLFSTDPNALIADYNYFPEDEDLQLVQSAMRLSAHVLARDPRQLAGQLTGRLLSSTAPNIQALLKQAAERKLWPWLRPLQPSLGSPSDPLIRTLESHTDAVLAVAITPDGHRAVSASADRTLLLWDFEKGKILCTYQGHTDHVWAVAVTPDGRYVISGSADKTLRLWDLESGKSLRTLEGHTGLVRDVAITPDGRRAVSASLDETLRVWDLETGEKLRTLTGHTSFVRATALTPDGRHAISASGDQTLRIWDLESGETLRTLEGHTDGVFAVDVMADGRRAVSGSGDKTLRLWDLESGKTILILKGHSSEVEAVAITPDGHRAISGSGDLTELRVWDLESGQELYSLSGHADWITSVAVTPDGHRFISASLDRTLRVWDLKRRPVIRSTDRHTGGANCVAVTPDGRRAVSGSSDHTLRLWDLKNGGSLQTLQGHTASVNCVAVTPDGRRAVSGSSDHTLRIWDLESGKTLHTLGHIDLDLSERQIDLIFQARAARSGQPLLKIKGHWASVNAVAVTPDGRFAVSAAGDLTLRIWDLESGETTCVLLVPQSFLIQSVAVAPDGHRTILAGADAKPAMRVLDLDSGETLRTLIGHTAMVRTVAVTSTGHRAVSASLDRTLRVWDLESGQTVQIFRGHKDFVYTVALMPDGSHAVSGGHDCVLRIWNLQTGEEITSFTTEQRIAGCAAAFDGLTICAADGVGNVHLMRLVEADPTKPSIGETKIPLLLREQQPTDKPKEPPDVLPTNTRAVFISYAHADNESRNPKERWLDRFIEFLQPLVSQENFTLCSDQDIQIGDQWHEHIKAQLNAAKAVVLLVSPAFLASSYIRNSELPVILKNATIINKAFESSRS